MDHSVPTANDESTINLPLSPIIVYTWNFAVECLKAHYKSKDPSAKMDACDSLKFAIDKIIDKVGPSWKLTRALDPKTVVPLDVFESLVSISAETSYISFLLDPATGGKIFRKTSPVASIVTPPMLETFEEAFDKIKFVNRDAAVRLKKTLSQFALQWPKEDLGWYAPFTALLNASMTGKSRLLVELHSLNVFIFCMCFRADKRSSYRPMRTPFVADWATGRSRRPSEAKLFTIECCAILLACLKQLLNWLKKQTCDGSSLGSLACRWYTEQQVEEQASVDFWHEIWTIREQELAQSPRMMLENSKFDGITEHFDRKIAQTKVDINSQLRAMGINLDPRELHVLFVFDEAGQLAKEERDDNEKTNRLMLLRRALRCIPATNSVPVIFCALTDTTSEVATLSPISAFEDSYRLKLGGKRPFPPLCLTFSIDVWWGEIKKLQVKAPCASSNSEVLAQVFLAISPQGTSDKIARKRGSTERPLSSSLSLPILERAWFMAVFGRPIFFSFLLQETAKNVSELISVPVLLNFLKQKLLRQPLEESPTQNGQIDKEIDEELVADFGTKQVYPTPGNPIFFTQAQILAVLGSIASIEVNAGSRMASELVSGHLRLAAAVTKLRKYIYTLEVSEPMLALAAHNLIMTQVLPWNVIIDKFNATQLNNSTAIGYRGELAFQILSLMAWQNVLVEIKALNCSGNLSPDLLHFPSASVEKYLTSLFGSRLSQLESNAARLLTEVCEKKKILEAGDLDYLRGVLRSLSGRGLSKRETWRQLTEKASERVTIGPLRHFVQAACTELNSAESWVKVKRIFVRGRVRPYQFVKVIGKVSKTMLVEFFVRGSVIVCRNNEGVVDIIIPVFFPLFDDDCVSVDKMGAVVIQVKLRADFSSDAAKTDWLMKTEKLDFLNNDVVPSLGIYCELGAQNDPEECTPDMAADSARRLKKGSKESRQAESAPLVEVDVPCATWSKLEVVERPTGNPAKGCTFAIFSRRLSVADIRANDFACQEAFYRLLESTVDPSESKNVDALFRADIREMFKVQPYMTSNTTWASGRSIESLKPKRCR